MQTLDTFIHDLLVAKGYDDTPADIKEALQKDLRIRIDEFIMARTIATFSESDVKEFEKMIDEGKPLAELQQFAMDHIPDYPTFLASTLVEFQDVYVSSG